MTLERLSEDLNGAPSLGGGELLWVGGWERDGGLTEEKAEKVLCYGGCDGSRKERLVAQVKWCGERHLPSH